MRLAEAVLQVHDVMVASDLETFRRHIDVSVVEEALLATGTASIRRRRLPAEQVVWLVIGMALMRNDSIERVARWLELALPSSDGNTVARSALAQARQRLGEEPLAYLFTATAAAWAVTSADRHRWRGLSLYGVDGTTMRVPDSKENWEEFGGQPGNGIRDGSAYPTVRLVAAMALRSHILSALVVSDYKTGETTLWRNLWRELPDDSLIIVDRNFLIADDLTHLVGFGPNRHWMTRAKTTTRLKRIQRLGRNDELVEIELSAATRRLYPDLPERWIARAITYRKNGKSPSVLLTSLLDARAYPAVELVGLYHERWELELGFDEVKTHMLEREEALRSRTPVGVRQEIWGIGLAYNLVRVEMERVAEEAGVEPTRISFINALVMVRNVFIQSSTPPMMPAQIVARLGHFRRDLKLLVLPERRPERSYPRAVKIKLSKYPRKKPTGRAITRRATTGRSRK